jgi:hypothetical protein
MCQLIIFLCKKFLVYGSTKDSQGKWKHTQNQNNLKKLQITTKHNEFHL